jgi:acyl-CoA synthetase (NDP forming)
VLKSGRSSTGRRAAASHTGSLAGRDGVFSGACRQFGAIRAASLTELYDAAKALATLGASSGDRVLFLSTSGGSGTLAVDEAERLGLTVSPLPSDFVDRLEERGLAPASRANPLDLDTDAAGDFEEAATLGIELGLADYVVLGFGDPIPGAAEVARRLWARLPGGILAYYLGGGETQRREVAEMHASGIPVFPTPERAAYAVSACVGWTRMRGAMQTANDDSSERR